MLPTKHEAVGGIEHMAHAVTAEINAAIRPHTLDVAGLLLGRAEALREGGTAPLRACRAVAAREGGRPPGLHTPRARAHRRPRRPNSFNHIEHKDHKENPDLLRSLRSLWLRNGTENYTYDDWGRQVSKSRGSYSASYEYRYGGMLYEVVTDYPGSFDVRFEYRGDRKRHSSGTPGVPSQRVQFDWDAGWNMMGWAMEHDGTVINQVIANPYSPVNAPAYDKRGGVHFADQIGSTRALMTETGTLARAMDYAPYGEPLADSGGAVASPYQFGGKIAHAPQGLTYFPYRYYSAGQARWTTRDPLGMVDGPNVYAYVGGNPVNFVDPLGLQMSYMDCVIQCGGTCCLVCLGGCWLFGLLSPLCVISCCGVGIGSCIVTCYFTT